MNTSQKILSKVFGETQRSDITFAEFTKAVGVFGFTEKQKGKTSGSRVAFSNDDNVILLMHKPHCSDPVNRAAIKQAKNILKLNGYM